MAVTCTTEASCSKEKWHLQANRKLFVCWKLQNLNQWGQFNGPFAINIENRDQLIKQFICGTGNLKNQNAYVTGNEVVSLVNQPTS